MSSLASSYRLAIVFAVLCLSGAPLYAQVAPLRYWIPNGPFGFGGSAGQDSGANSPAGTDAGRRYNFPGGFFLGNERGNAGWNGISQAGSTANFGALSYESTQFGYNYKTVGGLPVTVYAGFDTLKYGNGLGSSLAPLTSGTAPGYSAFAGVEFKPASNLSLSLGFGYTQQQSGRMDSDINSAMLPGESPIFGGFRR